jgi:hypothetical protein
VTGPYRQERNKELEPPALRTEPRFHFKQGWFFIVEIKQPHADALAVSNVRA